jgi:hypothetical protein
MIGTYNNKNHTNKIISNKEIKHVRNKVRDFINKQPNERLISELYKVCIAYGMEEIK